jgi:hypothetical protein
MKSIIACFSLFVVVIAGAAGCGGGSASTCDCAVCINDQPAYPCDSDQSCQEFADEWDCVGWQRVDDPELTCGSDPQPRCQITGCSEQCQCPE